MSLPRPPSSTSSPRMPRSRSSPPRPIRRSLERVPSSVSGPSVPVSTARPGWTTSPPGRPETVSVLQPRAGGRGEHRDGPARAVAHVQARAVGRPDRPAGAAAGRRAADHAALGEVDERRLAVDAAQLRAGRDDRVRAVGRDAEAAAAVGAERDRGGDARRRRARRARCARRGAGGPCAASWRLTHAWPSAVDAHARRAGDAQPADEPPGREVEDRDLAAGLDDDRAVVGDRHVDRRAGQLALADRGARSRCPRGRPRPCGAAQICVPSAVTASASGVPGSTALPAPVRAARSMIETVEPAAR